METEIKKLFQDKIIKIDGKDLILDINELMEQNLESLEFLRKNTLKFISLVKLESETYGLINPHLKILNWDFEKDISEIRVKDLGETVKLDGMVSKITDPMSIVISKKFECVSCGVVLKTSGKTPKRCSCGGRIFKEIHIELQDIQELVLEELQSKTSGKQPQKIRIRLVGNLTNKCFSNILRAGNRISVIGVIDKIKLNNKTEEEIFQYRIFALDISDLDDKFDDTINDDDLSEIVQISTQNPLDRLSDSLAPNIWGREELKKILVLQMVGGVKREMFDGKFTRNWISILVVGSPSTSKSDLAMNTGLRTPKSFYASGDSSSGVGLTVSAVKDEILGNWAAEVGPIVKGSGSTAIIDELDKFPKDQLKALHTPMELGFVKFNKAGMDSIFPAETSVLAMANPKYGVFEENKPLVEQINLPPALLSRFDIIYILKDEINKELDDQIVEVIYSQKKKENTETIPVSLFRKYVSYARKIEPTLPIEHLEVLKTFYHDVRKKSISRDSKMKGMPIGTRHLQGIIRLAEASAKIRLSEVVEKEDIDLAKNLFYDSLVKIGLDEGGILDIARVSHGKTISKRKLMDFAVEKIRILRSENEEVSNDELYNILKENKFPMNKFDETISDLNREGIILKSGKNWKLY